MIACLKGEVYFKSQEFLCVFQDHPQAFTDRDGGQGEVRASEFEGG